MHKVQCGVGVAFVALVIFFKPVNFDFLVVLNKSPSNEGFFLKRKLRALTAGVGLALLPDCDNLGTSVTVAVPAGTATALGPSAGTAKAFDASSSQLTLLRFKKQNNPTRRRPDITLHFIFHKIELTQSTVLLELI